MQGMNLEWDYVTICVSDPDTYRKMLEQLIGWGIDEDSILPYSTIIEDPCHDRYEIDKASHITSLIIIFNHRYDDNIEKLRRMYQSRFSVIRFLVPFYTGESPDVIPVYASSYYYQLYITQAYPDLMMLDTDFYLFVGDDVMLDEGINEHSAAVKLGLRNRKVFIYDFLELNIRGGFQWMWAKDSSEPFLKYKGTHWQNEIPDRDEAFALFERFFSRPYDETYTVFFEYEGADTTEIEHFIQTNGGGRLVPYPMARGYSDVLAIRKDVLGELVHIFGVFAAMEVFVEIAIPTSIVLLFDREEVAFMHETEYGFMDLYWAEEGLTTLGKKYDFSLRNLKEGFPVRCLAVHPVKLSMWDK